MKKYKIVNNFTDAYTGERHKSSDEPKDFSDERAEEIQRVEKIIGYRLIEEIVTEDENLRDAPVTTVEGESSDSATATTVEGESSDDAPVTTVEGESSDDKSVQSTVQEDSGNNNKRKKSK